MARSIISSSSFSGLQAAIAAQAGLNSAYYVPFSFRSSVEGDVGPFFSCSVDDLIVQSSVTITNYTTLAAANVAIAATGPEAFAEYYNFETPVIGTVYLVVLRNAINSSANRYIVNAATVNIPFGIVPANGGFGTSETIFTAANTYVNNNSCFMIARRDGVDWPNGIVVNPPCSDAPGRVRIAINNATAAPINVGDVSLRVVALSAYSV